MGRKKARMPYPSFNSPDLRFPMSGRARILQRPPGEFIEALQTVARSQPTPRRDSGTVRPLSREPRRRRGMWRTVRPGPEGHFDTCRASRSFRTRKICQNLNIALNVSDRQTAG